MYYAIIDINNLVVNVVIWDGQSAWQPSDNCVAVQIPLNSEAGIGWSYIDGEFTPPSEN